MRRIEIKLEIRNMEKGEEKGNEVNESKIEKMKELIDRMKKMKDELEN